MKKEEFITKVSERAAMSKKDTKTFMEALEVEVINAIRDEDVVPFAFAKIGGKTKDGRTCRNPKTGEVVEVATKKGYPYAKFSSVLKK